MNLVKHGLRPTGLFYWVDHAQPEVVGGGARPILYACPQQASPTDESALSSLHRFLKPRMEQKLLIGFLAKVVPGKKWLKGHTQHVCCELRRWRRRKRVGRAWHMYFFLNLPSTFPLPTAFPDHSPPPGGVPKYSSPYPASLVVKIIVPFRVLSVVPSI